MAARKKEQTAAERAAQDMGQTLAAAENITPEQDEFAALPSPCVYCGPSVRGVARQYTTYR